MRLALDVIGSRRAVPIHAIIDTGFDGQLCIPTSLAVTLGLDLLAEREVEFADGRVEDELLFLGQVTLLGITRDVEIALTHSNEALVGTALLSGCTLFIDFDTEEFRLERKAAS